MTNSLSLTEFIVISVVDEQELRDLRVLDRYEDEQINWGTRFLGLPPVWEDVKGEGVKVAVLDTGIDTQHPDLKDAILDIEDFTTDGTVEDFSGHGTHCAGIIASRENGAGIVGVAPKCNLLIGKVMREKIDATGNIGYHGEYQWLADGVKWAIDRGADIISISLAAAASDDVMFRAIHEALFRGIHVICGAGNEGASYNTGRILYPGRYGGVITVASHDRYGDPSGFSSRGGEIDVMAPGSDIWSTYKNQLYAKMSGTSVATPFVAGLAALIVAKHKQYDLYGTTNETPVKNTEDLRNHLLWMATHSEEHDNQSGYGLLKPFSYFNTYLSYV